MVTYFQIFTIHHSLILQSKVHNLICWQRYEIKQKKTAIRRGCLAAGNVLQLFYFHVVIIQVCPRVELVL